MPPTPGLRCPAGKAAGGVGGVVHRHSRCPGVAGPRQSACILWRRTACPRCAVAARGALRSAAGHARLLARCSRTDADNGQPVRPAGPDAALCGRARQIAPARAPTLAACMPPRSGFNHAVIMLCSRLTSWPQHATSRSTSIPLSSAATTSWLPPRRRGRDGAHAACTAHSAAYSACLISRASHRRQPLISHRDCFNRRDPARSSTETCRATCAPVATAASSPLTAFV